MRIFSQDVQTLKALYFLGLKKALNMEETVVNTLQDLVERSTDPALSQAFLGHLDETRSHVSKLEGLQKRHLHQLEKENCRTAHNLAVEVSDVITDTPSSSIRDIALIGIAQQIEHHEIAVYGTLRRWAELAGFVMDAGILESIEAEEANADEILTEISRRVNTLRPLHDNAVHPV
jgi:ferritin-like metal-binding protein YciE